MASFRYVSGAPKGRLSGRRLAKLLFVVGIPGRLPRALLVKLPSELQDDSKRLGRLLGCKLGNYCSL